MLPHYSPLKVAQSFSVLAGLYPGRIDLGIGRAAGTDPMTTFALQRDRRQAAPDDFPQQLAELLAYFDDSFPDGHALGRYVATLPGRPELPALAARLLAAERDLGRRHRPALRVRRLHQPRGRRDRARSTASASRPPTGCGRPRPRSPCGRWRPTPTRRPHASRPAARCSFTLLRQGRLIPVPPPDKAVRFLATQDGSAAAARRRTIVGTPEHGPRGPRRGRRAVRGRGGHRGHDHARPRGPPALLRADRRGVRPRRRRPGARGRRDARLTPAAAGSPRRRAKPRP